MLTHSGCSGIALELLEVKKVLSAQTAATLSGETALKLSGETALTLSGETALKLSGETALKLSGETALIDRAVNRFARLSGKPL